MVPDLALSMSTGQFHICRVRLELETQALAVTHPRQVPVLTCIDLFSYLCLHLFGEHRLIASYVSSTFAMLGIAKNSTGSTQGVIPVHESYHSTSLSMTLCLRLQGLCSTLEGLPIQVM